MGRLKILFVTTWYPTADRPVDGIFVREHAKAVQLYDDVVVLHCAGFDRALRASWRLVEEQDAGLTEGVRAYRLWWRLSPLPKTSYLFFVWAVLRAYLALQRAGFRPDVIHAHVYEASVPAAIVAQLFRLPLVITEHFSAFPRRALSRVDVWKARIAFRLADRVLPVGEALRRGIQDNRIRARFEIVPNVADTALFFPDPGRPRASLPRRLLFVGALEPKHIKGVPYLLDALAILHRRRSDWRLDIIGDGPTRSEYERKTAELGLATVVTFHGHQPKPSIAALMRRADLFVLPSLWENNPCVVLEAMASGLPVLSTRAGGIPELVDDTAGRLVPPADAAALAEALDQMLDRAGDFSPDLIARRAAERFSPDRVGQQIDAVYRAVVRNRLAGQETP